MAKAAHRFDNKKPKAKKPKPIPALGARGKETHGAVHPPGPGPGPGALPLARIFQSHYQFETVLDLGCGVGHLFPVLGKRAKKIIGMDMIPEEQLIHRPPPSVEFEYRRCDVDWSERLHGEFDAIIACNIIEHVADTEQFLRWFFSAIPEDGAWCLIFPLPKDELGDGHVHVFNHGLMLYNIVRIGIDCHKVEMYNKGYACAIMGKKRTFKVPKLANGTGDIAKLSSRFPFPAKHRCDAFDVPGLVVLRPDKVQIIRWCVTKYYGFGEED